MRLVMIKSAELKCRLLTLACGGSLLAMTTHGAIEDGLVAHYDFEAAELGADASGNGHALTNRGATSREGIKGNGAALNGFSSLETTAASDFNTAADFTWSAWFTVEDEELSGGILSKSPEGWQPGAKALFKGEGSFLGFDVGWLGAAEYDGDILGGRWHHALVVGEFTDDPATGLIALYVNGERVAEVEGAAEEFAEPADSVFRIGSGSPGDPGLDEGGDPFPEVPEFFGGIDEVRIYDRALGFEDIKAVLIDGLGELGEPVITRQPAGAQGIAGREASLSVGVSGYFVEYQWFKGDQAIDGATGPVLSWAALTGDDAGDYRVVVSNDAGSIESATVAVAVADSWTLDSNLLGHWDFDTEGNPGKDASGNGHDLDDVFTFRATGIKGQALDLDRSGRLEDSDGSLPFNTLQDFTWSGFIKTEQENGTIIAKSPGDDDPVSPKTWSPGSKALFVRDGLLGFDTGWIGDVGSPTPVADGVWHHVGISADIREGSDVVQLWVDGNPSGLWEVDLEDQPDVGIFFIGYGSDDFPFGGEENWFFGQIDEVRLYTQALIQEDMVRVFIEDGGTVRPPEITTQPLSTTVIEGRTARFRVGASGTGVRFQWKKGDADIEGATSATLSIPNASKSDAGEYSVVVTSGFVDPPVSVVSEAVTLTVEDAPVFAGGELAHVGAFLESYWSFDEVNADGLVPDLSPNAPAHDGELIDAVLTSGGQGYGGSGEAMDTSGAIENAYLAAGAPEAYDFNADFTWTARVKIFEPASFGEEAGAGIFGRSPADEGHTAGAKVFYLNGDTLGFDTGWVGAINSDEPTLTVDSWHQVTLTYEAADDLISIYLDDQPIISNEGEEVLGIDAFGPDGFVTEFAEDVPSGEGSPGLVNSGFRIGGGAEDFFAERFPGLIDDVAVWSVALSPEDVALLANGASPLPEIGEPPSSPTIGLSREAGNVRIEFTGELEASDDVTGPWERVDGAASPYDVDTAAGPNRFYRSVN